MSKKKSTKCKREARWTVWPGRNGNHGHLAYIQSCDKHLSHTMERTIAKEAYIYHDMLGGPCHWNG